MTLLWPWADRSHSCLTSVTLLPVANTHDSWPARGLVWQQISGGQDLWTNCPRCHPLIICSWENTNYAQELGDWLSVMKYWLSQTEGWRKQLAGIVRCLARCDPGSSLAPLNSRGLQCCGLFIHTTTSYLEGKKSSRS